MNKMLKGLLSTTFSISFQILVVLLIVSVLMNVALESVSDENRNATLEEVYETTIDMISGMNVDDMNAQTNYTLYQNYQLIEGMGIDETTCSDFVAYIDNWALKSQAEYIEMGVFFEFDELIDQILNYSRDSDDNRTYVIYTSCKNDSDFDILGYFKPRMKDEFEDNLLLHKDELIVSYDEQIDSLLSNIENSIYLRIILDYTFLIILIVINLVILYYINGFEKTSLSIGINILFTGILFIVFNMLSSSIGVVSNLLGDDVISPELIENVTDLSFYQNIMIANQKIAIIFCGIGIILIGMYFVFKKKGRKVLK